MSRASFVILGVVVTAMGLFLGVYYATIPCATNLVDAQRLGTVVRIQPRLRACWLDRCGDRSHRL